MQKKEWLRISLMAVLATLSALVCARLLLRNLAFFLRFDTHFSAIFAQIADAKLRTPILLLLAVMVAFWSLFRLGMKRKWKLAAVLCCIMLWLLGFASTVLLTKVNGIRFCDVLFSLLDVMDKGGL